MRRRIRNSRNRAIDSHVVHRAKIFREPLLSKISYIKRKKNRKFCIFIGIPGKIKKKYLR